MYNADTRPEVVAAKAAQLQANQIAQLERSVIAAFQQLITYLDGKTTKSEVINKLSVSTPDAIHVVRAIKQLDSAMQQKNVDLSPVTSALKAIHEQLTQIPKEAPEGVESVTVSNLSNLDPHFKALEGAIKGIKLVAEPKVSVQAPDLKPLQLSLSNVLNAIQSLKFPEVPETNLKGVEKRLEGLGEWHDLQVKELKTANDSLKKIVAKPVGGGGGGGTPTIQVGGVAVVPVTNPDGSNIGGSSSGLTDTQLRATPVPVSGTVSTSTPANGSATGTLSATGSVTLTLPAGTSGAAIQLISSSFVGTIVFESSEDGGVTYNARVYRGTGILNNLQTTLTNPATGDWRGNATGMTHVRVRCTAYTSGSLAVTIISSTGTGPVFLNAPVPIGSQSNGNTFSGTTLTTGNSTTGTYEDISNVASIITAITSTQIVTLRFQYSQDGTTLFNETTYSLAANTAYDFTPLPRGQYFRLVIDNASGSTATLNVETLYRATALDMFRTQLGNASQVKDNILAPIVRSVATMRTATDTYVDVSGDANGALKIRDDYQTGEILADQNGAGAVLTFTFTTPVDFVWLTDIGTTTTNISRCDPFGGTPTATLGVPVFNQAPTPINVTPARTTIKVYTPTGSTISCYGYRRG